MTLLRRAASAVDVGEEELTGTRNVVPKAAIRLSPSAMMVRRDHDHDVTGSLPHVVNW